MYRHINSSEKDQIKNRLDIIKDTYKVYLNRKRIFERNFENFSLTENIDFINYFQFDKFYVSDLEKLLGPDFKSKMKEFLSSIYNNTKDCNSEVLKCYAENIVFFESVDGYTESLLYSESFHENFFNSICKYYDIPEDLKNSLISLTLGDSYYHKIYSEEEYDEKIDEIYDVLGTTYDLENVINKLANHFNIFAIAASKDCFGTKEYYSEGLDIYFEEDFEEFKESVPFGPDGYVEDDYDYYSIFESDGDIVIYFKKIFNEKLVYSLEKLSPQYTDEYCLTESAIIVNKDEGYSKWYINNNCTMQGFTYSMLNILIITLGGY